ncbi:dnaJ homolog subfamily B member 13-like isoform X1 [Zingiber officinale]|uniref:dnaJ homolog subfamily B member 13-like isoform X1 n=1 Tax=Zingiber officinale TaxID=94328 RepID=UPI001C4B8342|nr:dnaJ homolog subfamily B member 13-like isoform X1 [Zingiber officinale]
MGVDYYKILGVYKSAKEDELKQAYLKLPAMKGQAEAKFKKISEAYEVLSDPQKRAVYDYQYGEKGLKGQISSGHPMSSDDAFAEYFGFSNPFGGMSGSGGGGGGSTRNGSRVNEDIFGSTFGETIVEEILTIDVKPGWKKGTKITFPEKGNESPNLVPADIAFIIDEKPHPLFRREGNDLVMTQKISLAEALTDYTAHLTTLDGRSLTIPISNVIHPGYKLVVAGEGMPFPKDPSRKGNLCINFYIKFPKRLTAEQKAHVKRAALVP